MDMNLDFDLQAEQEELNKISVDLARAGSEGVEQGPLPLRKRAYHRALKSKRRWALLKRQRYLRDLPFRRAMSAMSDELAKALFVPNPFLEIK